MVKLCFLAAIVVALAPAVSATTYEYKTLDYNYGFDEHQGDARSVIMMIPDGTGPNIFTLARTVNDPTLKQRLHIDPYLSGTIQTHSSTSYITDSASSATAYATGYKTYDEAIGVDHFKQPLGTVLEAAKARGMITGMIVTSRVTHATPASFASHVIQRDDEDEIARQYVNNKNLDFLLGGGLRHFNESMLTSLTGAGYTVAKNYADLLAYKSKNEASGNLRIFGLFHKSHMSYEVDRARVQAANTNQQTKDAREPSLPEMVDIILSILKNNAQAKKNGFFMMIEGSRVDHAGHSNDPGTMAKDAITFDEAFAVVDEFLETSPNTALISAADHGTGGLTLGRDAPYVWFPTALQKQMMSTEAMKEKLDLIWKTEDCAAGANETCKATILNTSKDLLKTYTNVTSLADDKAVTLKSLIAKAVDGKRDLNDVMIELGHVISVPAAIGWTTTGHVGTDVNLYCKGPYVVEQMCKGVHENTYVNKIMTNFLGLEHGQDIETAKHRKFQVLN
uniref:Alkaline phosphatase n=1 Tax=Globisporangium ultimum (strain ATCC 200006 / CBS 805.95 / DAOM BR144) TaxID=431595 RepID=K3W7V9_GLOUD